MNKNILVGTIVVLALIAGAYYYFNMTSLNSNEGADDTNNSASGSNLAPPAFPN